MEKVEIYKDEAGGFVIVTPEKCLTSQTLDGILSEVRSAFRQETGNKNPEPCPYCNSTDTIGHGLRETNNQVLTRRFCNGCHKTWVSDRVQKIIASTKEQVRFLSLFDYTEKEIAEAVKRTVPTVREHLQNIEIAEYRAKQAEAQTTESSVISAHEDKAVYIEPKQDITITSDHKIIADEFDRTNVPRERIGNFTVWSYNGRLAAVPKGSKEAIFLTKESIAYMKQLRNQQGRQALIDHVSQLQEEQRQPVIDIIETLIDEALGMFKMVSVGTTANGDFGEIDADVLESGRWSEN